MQGRRAAAAARRRRPEEAERRSTPPRPTTSCSPRAAARFTIRLDQKTSPKAAASFAALARNGFFDDTIFHRIVPGFVIQGGDPTASGTGGPGYSTRDRVPRMRPITRVWSRWPRPATSRRHRGQPVLRRDRRRRRPDARLRAARQGHEGHGRGAGDRRARRPGSGGAGTPLQSVVIEKATVREH